ncbi:hypothetical protein D3C76_1761790 [compost metagenome]
MGLGHQRVTQENDQVHLVLGNQRADLLVPAQRARQESVDFQRSILHDLLPGRSRGIEPFIFKNMFVGDGEIDNILFLAIMSNKCDV